MGEIHVLSGPAPLTADQLRRQLIDYLRHTNVDRAILFGSYARGDADFASDVDLVLIEETSAPFLERGLAHLPLFHLGVGLDLIVYTSAEYEKMKQSGNPLVERIEREGVAIYARSEK